MDSLVQVSLFAMTVSSGEQVAVAQINIEDGWHIYWENPGQSGYPTEFSGECVADTVYAPPHQFTMPGGIINYGYEGSVRLFGTGNCQTGDVVTLSWLSCREDTCIPGEYRGPLNALPNRSISTVKQEWNRNTNTTAFPRHSEGWAIVLAVSPQARVEFFPTAELEALSLEPVVTSGFWRQRWQLKGPLPIPQSEKLVVRVEKQGKEKIIIFTSEE